MKEFKPVKAGKVREIYDNGDSLIMVATDRISAFDHILKNKIVGKGKILTQMSKFWFTTLKTSFEHLISMMLRICRILPDRGVRGQHHVQAGNAADRCIVEAIYKSG